MRVWLFLCCLNFIHASIPYPDFKTSTLLNHTDGRSALYERMYERFDPFYVHLFEDIYNRNIAEANAEPFCAIPRIPKIVHQIWLGGPVPEMLHLWMASWASLQGWDYKLWTDKEAAKLSLYNRDLFDAVQNLGEKSDILRLEILFQYGGVYVDTDFACVRPEFFEELHHKFDFYIGVEPLLHGFISEYQTFKFCNALIGSTPQHPLLKDLLVNLKANHLAYSDAIIFQRTGPSYLTRIISQYERKGAHHQRNMYFPCTLFYPFSFSERIRYRDIPLEYLLDRFPEIAAVHYWTSSWKIPQNNQSSYETYE